ncbi:MAG: asparaginase [Firmicutes bacterium]|nr:asparaginase [Bacillota bacterium]
MRRVLIITTGGTIASVESPDGLVPGITSQQLRAYLPHIGNEIDIDIKSLFHIDSTDMEADHWIRIARAVRDNYADYDGFVICHGTDTMAYTAAILSYLIRNSDKPVVLTGAQRPIGFEITDAKSNLQDSILYAADPASCGVQIVFAGKVIAGTRARKVRSMSYAAFASINLPEIAEIRSGRIIRYLTDREYYRPEREHGDPALAKTDHTESQPVQFSDRINPNVFLLKLTPGMQPGLIPDIFRLYDAIVIESFGAGGIPAVLQQTLFEEMEKYGPEEKVLAMTTQVTYEGSHLETYEVGRRIADRFQILEARDMTLEATIAKLMWILADLGQSWEEIRTRFYAPVGKDTLL